MTCEHCEYHKNRAARWRAEAYKQAGHDVIEKPWAALTDEEMQAVVDAQPLVSSINVYFRAIEAKLKEKNT